MLDDIEQGNFIVCLKPVLEAESEEVVGAEAVVRYHHKDLGIVDPGALPDTFWRKQSFSHYLDLYVFEEVCKTLRRWENEGRMMLPVSVNFSGATLRYESVGDKILKIIEKISCVKRVFASGSIGNKSGDESRDAC